MKKIVRTNIQLIAAIFIAFGLNSTARAMEEMEASDKAEKSTTLESSKKRKREETITLTSSDGAKFTVPRDIAELSGTIKSMLEDMESTNKTQESIEIPAADANSLKNIFTILKVVENIVPRNIDNQKSPYKVQDVVNELLKKQSFEQIRDTLFAADFFEIPFLFDALARTLVYADQAKVANIVNLLELNKEEKEKKDINEALSKINESDKIDYDLNGKFIPQFIAPFKKHLELKAAGITKEYSIADLIEEHLERIKLTGHIEKNTLYLSELGLTSLYGIEYIGQKIKTQIKYLNILNNKLISIEPNAFQGLDNLEILFLNDNKLTSIPTNALQGLNNLISLNLSANQLTTIPTDTFKGLKSLRFLYLTGNLITEIPTNNALQGLTKLQELALSLNSLNNAQKQTLCEAFKDITVLL